MKKKKILALIPLILCTLNGCNETVDNSSEEEKESVSVEESTSSPVEEISTTKEATFVNVYGISYDEVNQETDMDKFYSETKNENGSSHDTPHEYGFVDSVWHTLKVNDQDVSVYSARCGYDIHSFAWVDVETDGEFNLDVEIKLTKGDYSKVTVLPEKENVEATIKGKTVTSKISSFGSFSFAFDESPYMALTLYVAPYSKMEVPEGYSLTTINPGMYDNGDVAEGHKSLEFSEGNMVYLFKSGVYDITSISLPSNSIAYFERGCYMRVFEGFENDYKAALTASGTNTKVLGRALFDFSKCIGGDAKTKAVYSFGGSNMEIEGLISINSNTWTMCLTAAKKCVVSRCMFFGYRTYSDGIMFSDCQDCIARDNFVRTGDDAIEVKAFSTTSNQTNNILFENNNVWTDKGIAYGCIYESVHDVENVFFKNNAVGFAQASWSEHLGCCVIQMGSMKQSTWHDVHFENIEIFKTSCSAITLFNRANDTTQGGKIKDIYFKDINVKYVNQTNIPVYCINVVIKLAEGVDFKNSTIGKAYIDNVTYQGVAINENNYKDYTNISLAETAKFSNSNLKINTL